MFVRPYSALTNHPHLYLTTNNYVLFSQGLLTGLERGGLLQKRQRSIPGLIRTLELGNISLRRWLTCEFIVIHNCANEAGSLIAEAFNTLSAFTRVPSADLFVKIDSRSATSSRVVKSYFHSHSEVN